MPMKGQPDSLVKDFTKKRWLILSLLSVEIEILVTHQVSILLNLQCQNSLRLWQFLFKLVRSLLMGNFRWVRAFLRILD